jgi:hypothetical protein
MANYVLSFRGQSGRKPSAEEETEWEAWFQQIGASVVDFGHRVARSSMLGTGRSDGSELGGYVLITAGDLEEAVGLAKGCPGLRHGGAVEVGETVEMA